MLTCEKPKTKTSLVTTYFVWMTPNWNRFIFHFLLLHNAAQQHAHICVKSPCELQMHLTDVCHFEPWGSDIQGRNDKCNTSSPSGSLQMCTEPHIQAHATIHQQTHTHTHTLQFMVISSCSVHFVASFIPLFHLSPSCLWCL